MFFFPKNITKDNENFIKTNYNKNKISTTNRIPSSAINHKYDEW